MIQFIKAYIKSMRLYYAFITGIAGWLGVSFYEFTSRTSYYDVQAVLTTEKKTVILTMLFLGWGINQIFNDYLGLKEDRINAPHRPMVTGELNVKASLYVSAFLLIVASLITYFYLEPLALIPLWAGVLLNVLYEYAKGYGIWGNIVFGLMISTCPVYGFMASGPSSYPMITPGRIAVLFMVCLMNALMTYYTYFKDYAGDKAAGKKTIVVKYGIERARKIGLIASFLPAATFAIIHFIGIIPIKLSVTFWMLMGLTFFLEVWVGYLYYKNPEGEKTYYSLAVNFRACGCGQVALIGIFDDQLAVMLFLVTYIFIGFLFDLHQDSRG